MTLDELLAEKGIVYKKTGSAYLIRCLHPEHPDIHPSMMVNPITGIGKCFSCSYRVDIYNYFGLTKNTQSIALTQLKDKINKLHKKSDLTFPSGFNIVELEYRGVSIETLSKYSAFTCNQGLWDGRIWFPLYNEQNKLTVFIGRRIGGDLKPKYVFYPEHTQPPLFPNKLKIRNNELIIVEGIFDALNLIDNGIENVVCVFGIGKSKYDFRFDLLSIQYGIKTLIPLFDNDKAGNTATEKFINIYKKNFHIRRMYLPEGKDPGALTKDEITKLKLDLGYILNEHSPS